MGELDYQMALVLQHRFEQEQKSSRNQQDSDQELARILQEQFECEVAVEKPPINLVYSPPKPQINASKSLTDPSWELIDPTPDIHTLFVAFNQRYFWNKLLAVCVSWSKKMTSCAGVCSYNGAGGLCSITLSEPLLKLRPRKDLVETLLHEMIHAYLFVTHNNRDRDGHGPEFHKHMYRINKESGTNITVYHNFHDEVRLYQQHWWRCNGPCQSRKPYFGIVRRATNRAPGPNDRWWGEHSRTCGGTFIKVREPEKKTKPEKRKPGDKNKSNANNGDITKYIPTINKTNSSTSSNVKGFKDLPNTSTSSTVITKTNGTVTSTSGASSSTSNVKGFKDLVNTSTSTTVTTKTNGTVTSTSTPGTSSSTDPNNKTKPSTSKDKTETSQDSYSNDFLAVRNHWANKFNTSTNTNRAKTRRPSLEGEPKPKIPKTYAECPVCNQQVLVADLNPHLDQCLVSNSKTDPELKECPLCYKHIASSSFDGHMENCLHKLYDNALEDSNKQKDDKVNCLACGKVIFKHELNAHLDECMSGFFEGEVDVGAGNSEDVRFNCPFCLELVNEIEMDGHIGSCLGKGETIVSMMHEDF